MKIKICHVLSLYFSINDPVQMEITVTFLQQNCNLRKPDLAFHEVREELWNIWDMFLKVLEYLNIFSHKMYKSEANNYTSFSTAASIFQKDIFPNMFLQIYFEQYLKIHRIFAFDWFLDLKFEILRLRFETLLPSKYMKLYFWVQHSLSLMRTSN